MEVTTMTRNEILIKKQVQNKLQNSNDIKVELHDNVYSHQYLIDSIQKAIESKINVFHTEFDANTRTIYVKIKKSNIKKLNNTLQGNNSYYSLFNEIMNTFFIGNYAAINNLTNDRIDIGSLTSNVTSLYDLLILSDNLIAIRL